MRAGTSSLTARRVAAYRLGFERLAAPFGDPAADNRLARDVANGDTDADGEDNARMARYLRGRTRFIDAAVCGAMRGGILQVVAVGAGYDGRSLRYAKAGVSWFELDHGPTQQDKQRRLARLGIACPAVTFAPVDLERQTLAATLQRAGHDSTAASLFLCEGVAVYLTRPHCEVLLRELRSAAGPGSRLALTLSVAIRTPVQAAERVRLRRNVAAAGEPIRNDLTTPDAADLLTATGWEFVETSASAAHAGFVLALPTKAPIPAERPLPI